MDKNLLVAVLIVIAISSLFLISISITGMVSLGEDPYTRPLCSSDADCANPSVCCEFYGAESGVCHSPEMCPEILELTRQERIEEVNEVILGSSREEYMAGLLLGVTIIGFVIYFSEKALADKAKV